MSSPNGAPALAEIVGPWSNPQVNAEILMKLNEGFKIVFMAKEKRSVSYVKPDDPDYQLKQFRTSSGDEEMVTYMVRERR
jgi:hypothetical protein